MKTKHNYNCRSFSLLDIADIERAVKGKIYPSGTCYIQVSAARRKGLEQFKMLHTDSELESKYVAILPKVKTIPFYFLIALNNSADEFMERYVGTNINIQVENFKYFKLKFHDDIKIQKHIAEQFEIIEKYEEYERQTISRYKGVKEWCLDNMFI